MADWSLQTLQRGGVEGDGIAGAFNLKKGETTYGRYTKI
jgi:hypothetical protein